MKYIELTQGKKAIVDDKDFKILNKYKWKFVNRGSGYAARRLTGKHGVNKIIYIHQQILGRIKGKWIDHKNGNGLYNCRENLRFVNSKQSSQNRKSFKRYKGVYKQVGRVGYRSLIYFNGKSIYLGYFRNQKEAAKAYDEAAKKYFGEYAKLNYA